MAPQDFYSDPESTVNHLGGYGAPIFLVKFGRPPKTTVTLLTPSQGCLVFTEGT